MKNKLITVYELMGLVKDDKAPKKIKLQDTIYEYDKNINGYFDKNGYNLFYLVMSRHILNSKIEILPEENDDWEDLKNLEFAGLSFDDKSLYKEVDESLDCISTHINKIIKNQKYLKEKLESKND